MSKLKQRYLKEVKSFFPIMGKPERRHLKKLSEQIGGGTTVYTPSGKAL